MKRWTFSYKTMIAGILCLAAACTDDTEPVQDGNVLQVAGVTRADGDLNTEPVNTDGTQIKIFLTTNDASQTGVTNGQFTCTSSGSWNSTVALKENIQYYVYGYMPAAAATVSNFIAYNWDYSQGVDMTLSNLPAIGETDVCVLTGLQQVTSATAAKENWTEDHVGKFGYSAIASNDNTGNYAYLLMDHLYCALKFRFNVNAVYAGLRTIHLKELTLKTAYSTISATVCLRKGVGISAVSYSCSGDEKAIGLLSGDNNDVELPVAPEFTTIGTEYYGAPTADLFDTEGSHASIVCKYDIYDTNKTTEHPNGNLVRKDCTATNKLKLTSGMARGKKKILTLTVNPTYLYMLSDPDLDNPTVTIN